MRPPALRLIGGAGGPVCAQGKAGDLHHLDHPARRPGPHRSGSFPTRIHWACWRGQVGELRPVSNCGHAVRGIPWRPWQGASQWRVGLRAAATRATGRSDRAGRGCERIGVRPTPGARVTRAAVGIPSYEAVLVATVERTRPWPYRLTLVALGLLAVAFAARTVLVTGQERGEPNYAMPVAVVAVAVFSGVLTVVGAYVAARDTNGLRPWLTVLTVLLFLWGFLTMFSIGLGLLLAAVATLLVRLRIADHQPSGGGHLLVGAGLLLSAGLVPLSALSISEPVVQCVPGGVQSSVPMWDLFGSASGRSGTTSSGGSVAARQTAGHVTVGGATYAYTCTNGRLTSFQPG